jgi:colicin import membrane protein
VQRLKASAAQKEAQETADKAAKNAVSKLAAAMKTTSAATTGTAVKAEAQTTSTTKSAGSSGPRGTGIEPDFYMKLYLSAVYQKIHDHWVLPDLQNWDNSLEAVLSITIKRDGTVTDSNFERKSDNIYFNQFVLKAVKEASPLPPFPGKLKENTLEIGLRFKPGELY